MDTVSTGGKIKTKTVYTGPYYSWNMEETTLGKLRTIYTVLGLISCGLYIGSMLFYSNFSKLWFVIMPYACMILVLTFLGSAIINLIHAPQPMKRETKDRTIDRIKGSSVIGMIFCGGTIIGEIYAAYKLQSEIIVNDWLFLTATIFLFALMLYGFKASKRIRVKEEINPIAEKWKNR